MPDTPIIIEWMHTHSQILWLLSLLSLLTLFVTLITVPVVIARIPSTYFIDKERDHHLHYISHPVPRIFYLILKNLSGFLFIITGFVLLFLPGQGIITIFIGILLLNFPGKRRIALHIIRQKGILKTINWIRNRSNKKDLLVP